MNRITGIKHIPIVNPNICQVFADANNAFACSVISVNVPAALSASNFENCSVIEYNPVMIKNTVNTPCCNAEDNLTINGLTENDIASFLVPVFHSSYSIVLVNIINIVK